MSNKITLKMSDGNEITGTPEQILDLLNKKVAEDNSGPKYLSQSKGTYVPVMRMEETHLMNAVIKYGKEYLEALRGLELAEFYEKLLDGFYLHADDTGNVGVLLTEVERRV